MQIASTLQIARDTVGWIGWTVTEVHVYKPAFQSPTKCSTHFNRISRGNWQKVGMNIPFHILWIIGFGFSEFFHCFNFPLWSVFFILLVHGLGFFLPFLAVWYQTFGTKTYSLHSSYLHFINSCGFLNQLAATAMRRVTLISCIFSIFTFFMLTVDIYFQLDMSLFLITVKKKKTFLSENFKVVKHHIGTVSHRIKASQCTSVELCYIFLFIHTTKHTKPFLQYCIDFLLSRISAQVLCEEIENVEKNLCRLTLMWTLETSTLIQWQEIKHTHTNCLYTAWRLFMISLIVALGMHFVPKR